MDVIAHRATACDWARVSSTLVRRIVLAFALSALAAAVLGGLGRLGLVPTFPVWAQRHGAAMVGFLGVVIALERAWLLGNARAHLVPAVGVAGLLAELGGGPSWLGHLLLLFAGAGLVVLQGAHLMRRRGIDNTLMTTGALAWLVGQMIVLTGASPSRAVPAWASFVVLVILGERIELQRRGDQAPPAGLVAAGWTALILHLIAGAMHLLWPRSGTSLLGLGWCASGGLLLWTDPGVRAPARPGADRYVATALTLGFVWLVAAGLLSIVFAGIDAGPLYDARIHALFGGFGLTLLFAHGPQVLPALAGRDGLAWSRLAWAALLVLQLGAVGRVVGDLSSPGLRAIATALHAMALGAFVLAMVRGMIRLSPPRPLRF